MTKKALLTALLTAAAVILISCTGGGSTLTYTKDLTGARLEWSFGGTSYIGTVALTGEDPADSAVHRPSAVMIESPPDVAGLTVTYGEEGVAASVGNTSFDLPGHTGGELYALVRLLSFTENDVISRTGSTVSLTEATPHGELSATLTLDEDGFPSEGTAVLDGEEITVRFSEFYRSDTPTTDM